jgi:aminopeptidase N
MRLAWLRDFAAAPPGTHRPLAAFRARTHGAEAAVGYGKSAMVFVMLRDLIGDDAFERGIRAFWNHHRFRTASWDDLRRAFELTANRSLRTFFTQWVERPGGPGPVIAAARMDTEHGAVKLAISSGGLPAYPGVPWRL